MRKCAVILVFLMLVTNVASAQTIISGKITDTIGSPIPNISVMVHRAGNTAIAAFGFSDYDGLYKISVNIDSDSRLAMTAAIRKTLAEKPAEFDPRKYLGPARDHMKELYIHKIVNVLGSNDKLSH